MFTPNHTESHACKGEDEYVFSTKRNSPKPRLSRRGSGFRRLIYRLSLAVIIILLLSLHSYAFVVELIPKEVIPGDVFLLRVQSDIHPLPEAEFHGRKIDFHQAEDGHFIALVPVDIDTPPEDYEVIVKHKNGTQYLSVRVKLYDFPTQEITLPEEKVILSPENQKRVEREYLLLEKIWADSAAKAWSGRFMSPIDTAISEGFGIRRIINGKKTSIHMGVDYKGEIGTPLKAINSGRVALAEDLFYGGNTLIIDHGTGLFSIYMHLSSFNVSQGEIISKGQVIGFVGNTGRATGPHLHMSVKLYGVSVNPLSLFKLGL